MTGYLYTDAPEHDWLAVATTGRVLVARVGGDTERIAQVAAAGDPAASVQNVLEMLTAKGLSNVGPFALVFWVDGAMRSNGLGVIVRGGATVSVVTDDDTVTVSSRGVTTWTEQVIENAVTFTVDTGSGGSSQLLPLAQGAAWVSTIRLDNEAPQTVTTDAVGTAVTPEPVPQRPETVPEPSSPPESSLSESSLPESSLPESSLPESTEETRVFHTVTGVEPTAEAAPADADGYDYLFGATVFRTVGSAAVEQAGDDDGEPAAPAKPTPEAPATASTAQHAAPAATPALGDHDGHTMLAADILEARRRAKAAPAAPAQAPVAQTPAATPEPYVPQALQPPRQAHAYVLELPNGSRQELSAPVILGRAPSVSNVPASVLPHLVTLVGDDISRSHLRVAVEGGTVVVTDLHSSNGTHVIAPGKPPQLLRGGEPTPVIVGTAIDLGSDVLLRVTEA